MSLRSSMLARLRPVAFRLRPGAPRDHGPRASSGWAVRAALVATAAAYIWAHAVHGLSPRSSVPPDGWWHWSDQGRYVRAALAWASGDLDPARHWYLPGYPLLGTAFAWLTPAQPFYLPDLAGLVAAAWLFARLAARLMPGLVPPAALPPAAPQTDRCAMADGLGAAVFLATTVLPPRALDAWVVPWTTTPTAVLTLACLVLALRFADAPRARDAFLMGASAGGIALFRPTDAAVVLLALGPFLTWVLLRGRSVRRAAASVAAAGAGVLAPLAALFALHHAVDGWAVGRYLDESASIGFEWSLLPLRWVTLFVGPQPLFPSGRGLAQVFPWIVPGVAGMAACLALPDRHARPRHVLVIGATALHCAFYLAYRDLHPQGLFRFNNHHYFKWALPVFGLYAALLVFHLVASPRRLRLAGVGLLATAALFCWRARWSPDPDRAGDAAATGPNTVLVRGGFRSAADAVLIPAPGGFERVYFGRHTLRVDGRTGQVNADLKAFPVSGGLLFVPLRRYPARDTVLTLDAPLRVAPDVPVAIGTQHVVFGPPCWWPGLAGCEPVDHLPAPPLEAGQTVAFDGAEEAYLLDGWSSAEPGGRWTDGPSAALRVRSTGPREAVDSVLELQARAFVPGRRHGVRVTVYAGGERVAVWGFEDEAARTVRARIPAGAADATGSVRLRLAVDGARRPTDVGPSADGRELGLFVRSLTLTEARAAP